MLIVGKGSRDGISKAKRSDEQRNRVVSRNLPLLSRLEYLLERANSRNLVTGMDHCRRSSLGPHEDDIDEFRRRRHGAH
jgi:hypothetical protein